MNRLAFFIKLFVGACVLLLAVFAVIKYLNNTQISQEIEGNNQNSSTDLTPEIETALQNQIAPLIAAGDSAACNSITDASYKQVCKNNIAINQAKKTGDVSFCKNVDNVMVPRSFCESQIVLEKSVSTNNIQVCMEATDTTVQKSCTDAFNQRTEAGNSIPSMCDASEAGASCRLNEVLLSLTQAPQTTNCSKLTVVNEKTECAALKEVLIKDIFDVNALTKVCEGFETTFFKNVCNKLSSPTASIQKPTP